MLDRHRMRLGAVIVASVSLVWLGAEARAQPPGQYAPPISPLIAPDEKTAVSTYYGFDVTEESFYGFAGALAALNGDLGRPGFVFRTFVAVGDYDYRSEDVPGGEVDADAFDGDLMIGYQGNLARNVGWSALIGVNYIDNHLDPSDPSNPVRGSEVGFKVAGAVEIQDPRPFFWGLEGAYSTAYETYWSRARVGYKVFGNVVIGPEGVFMGDITYDTQRIGGFVSFPFRLTSTLTPSINVASGYGFVTNKDTDSGTDQQGFGGLGGGADGPYLTVSLGLSF